MLVHVPTQTVSPRWLVDTDSKTKNPLPSRSSIAFTVTAVSISSPATTSGPQRNSCPPWTISAKLMPTSGSNTRSEEHTSELQSRQYLVCRLLLEKKKISPSSLYTLIII